MSSILTNNSAMVALQTLKSVNSNLAKTQEMISTGKKVASAKDNSAVFAISKGMESDVAGFKAISESLSLGESTVAVARNASETVTDLLTQMKEKIVEGRIGKRLKELALMEQPFIKDSSITVADLVKQTAGKIGENVKVRRVTRYTLGEGIEVEENDFAAEVASMQNAG